VIKRSSEIIGLNFLNKISGTKMCKVGASTEVKLLKKSRLDGRPVPDKFNGLKKLSFFVASVGHDYGKLVNNRVNNFGTGEGYFVQPSTVSNHLDESKNGIMRVGIKDTKKFYVRLFFNTSPNNYNESVYINETGEVINPTNKEIEEFFPIKSDVKKQSDHGLDELTYVNVREFKAENIIYFQCGNQIWNNIGDTFLKLFNLECIWRIFY